MPFLRLSSSRISNFIPRHVTGIHSLPPELLCEIFLELPDHAFSLHSDGRSAPPVHALSHVCRGWRSVAQELCPSLWTDIRILHCRVGQPAMVEAYLRRSGGLLLDIVLDIHDTVEYLDDRPFWQVLLRVWSAAGRWRSLQLRTTLANFAAIRENLGGASVETPLLESLALFAVGNEYTSAIDDLLSGVATQATRVGCDHVHIQGMPMLKALMLHGVKLETDVSLFAPRLETLDLSFAPHGSAFLTSLAEQFHSDAEDLPLVPGIRHLTLRGSHIPESTALISYLSHLTALTLGNVDGIDAPSLCRSINASLLEELSLEKVTNAFWLAFSSVQMTFPVLHTLTLSSNSIAGHFLPGPNGVEFPALTRLRLSDFASCSNLITELGVSALESAAFIPWRTLTDLTVTGDPDYRALRTLVDARSAMGVPIRSLTVDSPLFIDASALNWLKRNVEEFTRVVPNPRR
ncbi:hypothetical protein FB45DRAFT_933221 [Roridomyces roridus]|uniref:F-box domain-containing protein n=1 Tax=Roridomyces roridus TaxID=1738132 RepID=A0AAD7FDV8_9AGAR|nr:hypothetical protein FB45DRAFT_933221 [Roridomyces roridus]